MRSLWPYPFAVLILTGCQQRFDTDPAAASERPALATISILAWNIESGGNDPAEISYQLSELSGYDIYAFSEVDDDNVMLYASSCGPHFSYVVSFSGRRDRLLTLFDAERFELLKHEELDSYRDIRLNDSNHRSPLVLLLQDRTSGVEFQVVTVHLARGDADLRTEQAKGLREWGRDQTLSTIAIGDFNMDFDFHTERDATEKDAAIRLLRQIKAAKVAKQKSSGTQAWRAPTDKGEAIPITIEETTVADQGIDDGRSHQSPTQELESDGDQKPIVEQFSALVISVVDGDTISVLRDNRPTRVRLEGIDAPETTQEHSNKATHALSQRIKGERVTLDITGTDKYGRLLAIVRFGGKSINEWLVSEGWAWHYKEYSSDPRLADLEIKARNAQIGLWQHDNPMPPWEFRDLPRKRAEPDPVRRSVEQLSARGPPPESSASRDSSTPAERYWLNTSSNVRHNAGCRWFGKTKRGRYCGPNEGKACGICGG